MSCDLGWQAYPAKVTIGSAFRIDDRNRQRARRGCLAAADACTVSQHHRHRKGHRRFRRGLLPRPRSCGRDRRGGARPAEHDRNLDSGRPGPSLLLNDHLDIVPPGPLENWRYPPFDAVVADGHVHGRGTIDTKSGLTTLLIAVRAARAIQLPISGKLIAIFTCDEETGGKLGMQHLGNNGYLKADLAVVARADHAADRDRDQGSHRARDHAPPGWRPTVRGHGSATMRSATWRGSWPASKVSPRR